MKGLRSVHGFGSFFRNEPHQDVDILAIIDDEESNSLKIYYDLRETLSSTIEGRALDLLMLTLTEFKTKPLKSMNELTPIWTRD
jgi:predicted nucleotidyltransferase